MSYSRWSNSDFYTYWCSSEASKPEQELFACHCDLDIVHHWRLDKIEQFLLNTASLVEDVEWGDHIPTEVQVTELIGYFKIFVDQVRKHYQDKQQC